MKKTVPLSAFRFDVKAISLESDNGTHRVKLQALSGEPINHWAWGQVVHDLSGMTHKEKVMIDWCHEDDVELGFVDKFDTDSGSLDLEGIIISLEDNDRASKIVKFSAKGVPYEASIFFPESKPGDTRIEHLGPGETEIVNGNEVHGPITIFRQWPLRRVAICPSGADGDTRTALSADDNQNIEVEIMEKENKTEEKTTPEVKKEELKVKPEPVKEEPETDARKEFKQFTEAFGAKKGAAYFGEGKTLQEAQAAFNQDLVKENAELTKKLSEKPEAKKDDDHAPFDSDEGESNEYWTDQDSAKLKRFCDSKTGAVYEDLLPYKMKQVKKQRLAVAS